jgi:putative transposase
MGRPLRVEYLGALYHITSRGNERGVIFQDNRDRQTFLDIISDYHERFGILIHGYVLMDNHYHLIIETPKGNLLKVMHGINSRYTGYFNRKYGRVGHLFQGRYRAIIVDKDRYLVELSRYIHLNPVRAAIVEKPEQYLWSSYRSYIGKGKEEDWVEYAWILSQFGKERGKARTLYREYTEKEIGSKSASPFSSLIGDVILGGEDLVKHVRKILKGKPISGEIVERRRIEEAATPTEIIETVCRVFGVDKEKLLQKRNRGCMARPAALYIIQRYSGLRNEEIGKIFGGIHYSAVTKAASRLQELIRTDKKLKKQVEDIISYIKT